MYLVIMPNSWAKGETIAQARTLARRHGGHRGRVQWIAFYYNPAATPVVYVDDMGRLTWEGARPARLDEKDPLTEVAKKALRKRR